MYKQSTYKLQINKQTQQQNLHIRERKTKGKTIIQKTKNVTNVSRTPRFQQQYMVQKYQQRE
jgi:hypothetical protein